MNDFRKCTTTAKDGSTWYISCKLNLWEVSGEEQGRVRDGAMHYFQQYKQDGEYHEIIGGDSPLVIMKRRMADNEDAE